MTLSVRYGWTGIGGLGLLTVVHGLREQDMPLPAIGSFLLGVLPNFAAAIAIAFVLSSIWCDQHRDAAPASVRRCFALCALISCVGLIGWEFLQIRSGKLVFDWNDLVATVAGLAAAFVLFQVVTPSAGDAID